MGFWSIALKKIKDADKDKRDFIVHSLINSSDLNSLESSIRFDYKLHESKISAEDQTDAKESMIKLDSSSDMKPE